MTFVTDPTSGSGWQTSHPQGDVPAGLDELSEVDAPLATITLLIYELDRQAVEIQVGVNAPPEQAPAIRDRALEVAQEALGDARAALGAESP